MQTGKPAGCAVRCRGITKEFGQGESTVRALRGVDLEAFAGQLTVLAGPSGCGKTTLLSVIAGLLDPTAGEVSVWGANLATLSRRERTSFRGRHLGFVCQQYNLMPALTAVENAALSLVIAGQSHARAATQARVLLETLGLGHRVHALPAQLSGGQQQRVAIARALIHQPRLVVCDEPTAALDADTGQAIMELLQRTAVQPDRAVLVVTHDPRVIGFGHRVVTLNDGRVERIEVRETPCPATELRRAG